MTASTPARLIHRLYEIPLVEWGLVAINLLGFLLGTIYWYGSQMAQVRPLLWPWLVDSPLSVLGFALALPLIRRGQSSGRRWLATWAAFSSIKYGLWTVVFWFLWWRGPGSFTLESLTMTFTHAAMVVMGFSLFLYFRPTWLQVVGVATWFGFNDYLDYWHGIAPRVPAGVSLETLQIEQIVVTIALTLLFLALAVRPERTTRAPLAGRAADHQ